MSLRAIAEEAGVSISTVSRVLNDKHRNKISEATRQRVLAIARALRYQPNPQAVALATGARPRTLGLVMPYHSHTLRSFYFSELSCGALDAANVHGMDVNLLVYRDAFTDDRRGFLSAHRVAGVILIGSEAGDPVIAACREAGLPFVAVNNDTVPADVFSVICDNEGGAYTATRHLLSLGHARIAHIAGPEHHPDARARRAGYCRAMEEAGVVPDERLIVPGDFNEQGGRRAMRALLASPAPPTALFAANDQSAIGALAVARRAGLRIPEDLAIAGFDDIPSAQHAVPALTTVHQPIYRMGQRAAQLLVACLEAQGDPAGLPEAHQVLRTRLVVRDSCGARSIMKRH